MNLHGFVGRSAISDAVIIEENSIVEPWPMQLKLRPGQSGSQEEFDLLLRSPFSGLERYVEWRRKGTGARTGL